MAFTVRIMTPDWIVSIPLAPCGSVRTAAHDEHRRESETAGSIAPARSGQDVYQLNSALDGSAPPRQVTSPPVTPRPMDVLTAGTVRLRANGRVCPVPRETARAVALRDAALAVTSLNLQRRRMDESQRALAAAKLANLGARRFSGRCANWRSFRKAAVELMKVKVSRRFDVAGGRPSRPIRTQCRPWNAGMSPSRPTPAGSGTSPPRSNAGWRGLVEASQAPTPAGAAEADQAGGDAGTRHRRSDEHSRGPDLLAAPIGELQAASRSRSGIRW